MLSLTLPRQKAEPVEILEPLQEMMSQIFQIETFDASQKGMRETGKTHVLHIP